MYLSMEFQEEYKRLDRLCKDLLRRTEGVSEYIRQMEATPFCYRRYVLTWDDDYKQLKHIRWIRNQLAHEVGTLYSNICTEDDLAWVQSFYGRILSGNAPFAVIRKAKEEELRRARQYAQTQSTASFRTPSKTSPKPQAPVRKKPSLFARMVAGIKKLFS